MEEQTKSSQTGCEAYDQLLKFTIRARDLGVVSFTLTNGPLTYQAHLLPQQTSEEAKKADEALLYGAG